jgi:hypothetical protein
MNRNRYFIASLGNGAKGSALAAQAGKIADRKLGRDGIWA